MAVILDHVKDEDGDGAVNIEDVKLFLKRNKAALSCCRFRRHQVRCFVEPEVEHGTTEVYARVQA
jgi:hypothetical protein